MLRCCKATASVLERSFWCAQRRWASPTAGDDGHSGRRLDDQSIIRAAQDTTQRIEGLLSGLKNRHAELENAEVESEAARAGRKRFRDMTYGARTNPPLGFGEGETDARDAGYMQEKRTKFGAPERIERPPELQPATPEQQMARRAALAANPFEASSGDLSSFMDYVETEQDYYEQGTNQKTALSLVRHRARETARKRGAELRTEEALGPDQINKLRLKKAKRAYNFLQVTKYDMRSFTLNNGVRVVGSCMILKDSYFLWDVTTADDITMEKLMPLAHVYPVPVFIVLGTGMDKEVLHPDVHMYMRSRGTRIDVYPTDVALSVFHEVTNDGYQCYGAFLPFEPTNGFDHVDYNKHWRKVRQVAAGESPSLGRSESARIGDPSTKRLL
eukprot:TRINITY_DN7750_c0_g1_i1.p1 TRINITY_DN7750_c0_g1~~TRINITY_DN7750_c0_g1_i1.p1  ORF type:complete len:387 (+),score=72.36 TRINITY_DN7750_c0_g1_i1:139-1299(+)